jgi:hypothetical protein
MKTLDIHTTAPVADREELDRLEYLVRCRIHGRIRDLRLHYTGSGLVLGGRTNTYHAKQLAQHAVMSETTLPIAANEIEVS